jgi:hypothetical protein
LTVPRYLPEAVDWPRCHLLCPRWSYFLRAEDRTEATVESFRAAYTAQLERFGPRKIARVLHMLGREHDASALALLCHEASWDRCHRQMWASWWLQATGEVVGEMEVSR